MPAAPPRRRRRRRQKHRGRKRMRRDRQASRGASSRRRRLPPPRRRPQTLPRRPPCRRLGGGCGAWRSKKGEEDVVVVVVVTRSQFRGVSSNFCKCTERGEQEGGSQVGGKPLLLIKFSMQKCFLQEILSTYTCEYLNPCCSLNFLCRHLAIRTHRARRAKTTKAMPAAAVAGKNIFNAYHMYLYLGIHCVSKYSNSNVTIISDFLCQINVSHLRFF